MSGLDFILSWLRQTDTFISEIQWPHWAVSRCALAENNRCHSCPSPGLCLEPGICHWKWHRRGSVRFGQIKSAVRKRAVRSK